MNDLRNIAVATASVLPVTVSACFGDLISKISNNSSFKKCIDVAAKTLHIAAGIISVAFLGAFFAGRSWLSAWPSIAALPVVIGMQLLVAALPLPIVGAVTESESVKKLSSIAASISKIANVLFSLFILPVWFSTLGINRGPNPVYLAGSALVALSVAPSFIKKGENSNLENASKSI